MCVKTTVKTLQDNHLTGSCVWIGLLLENVGTKYCNIYITLMFMRLLLNSQHCWKHESEFYRLITQARCFRLKWDHFFLYPSDFVVVWYEGLFIKENCMFWCREKDAECWLFSTNKFPFWCWWKRKKMFYSWNTLFKNI